MTYPGERNASFSANCNVLILLLVRNDRDQYVSQIAKVTCFLTRSVLEGHVREKWVSQPDVPEIKLKRNNWLTGPVHPAPE